jgi:ectoine hydroxylase-related dioxygenase (phytanoyl-CoA dioxygenase family)
MDPGPLSNDQIEEFIDRGWTRLGHVFPPAVAQAVRRHLGERVGIDLGRLEQWTQPQVRLEEKLKESPYTDALSERFHSAVDQLLGPRRWEMTHEMGWWPISFPGFDAHSYRRSWHIEGGWFHHHVWSPEQALLNLFCFSTVDSGGGGTLVAEGSHHLAARILWEAEPDGLEAGEFGERVNAILDQKGWPGVVEVVAEEGDVVLAHPLLLHSSSPNRGTRPRVMAQPAFLMTEPKRTDGDGLYPVEIPLARARP